MKLTPVTTDSPAAGGITQPYVPTIESDTNGSFSNYHIVPESYTKVVTFTSTTDFTIGSSLQSTYRVYIQGLQPADTYTGKVKYTLVHPNDANPPETPITLQETAELIDGYSFCTRIIDISGDGVCQDEREDPVYNYNIKAIKMSDSLPNNFTPSEENTISSADSYNPIYAWFDNANNTGIIYIYTDARKIYMNEDSAAMFADMRGLNDISAVADWDTSSVTNMGLMFVLDSSLANIDSLSSWDTSNVTSMSTMFYGARSLTDLSPLANWDTSNVTSMGWMFSGINNIDATVLNDWDVSKVTYKFSAFTCPVDKRPSWY